MNTINTIFTAYFDIISETFVYSLFSLIFVYTIGYIFYKITL